MTPLRQDKQTKTVKVPRNMCSAILLDMIFRSEGRVLIYENSIKSSQVTFIYIALLTIQIVSKQLHNIKIGK